MHSFKVGDTIEFLGTCYDGLTTHERSGPMVIEKIASGYILTFWKGKHLCNFGCRVGGDHRYKLVKKISNLPTDPI